MTSVECHYVRGILPHQWNVTMSVECYISGMSQHQWKPLVECWNVLVNCSSSVCRRLDCVQWQTLIHSGVSLEQTNTCLQSERVMQLNSQCTIQWLNTSKRNWQRRSVHCLFNATRCDSHTWSCTGRCVCHAEWLIVCASCYVELWNVYKICCHIEQVVVYPWLAAGIHAFSV